MSTPSHRLLASLLLTSLWTRGPLRADDWPSWRGRDNLGVSSEPGASVPLRWTTTENVRWKVPLPDAGNSTPVVWGEKLYLTQATDHGKKRALMCLSRSDGSVQWTRTIEYPAEEPTHGDNPYCSASPATDGKLIVVSHGSAGAACYDLDGKELWRKDLGKLHHIWGNASSPVLHGDLCFLNCGPGDRTFLLALDKTTGTQVWKVDVPGGQSGGESSTWTGSWSTPVIVSAEGREDLVIGYPQRVLGFEPRTGKEVWRCDGLGKLVYTSPVVGEGTIVAMCGYGGPGLAVRAGGKGDVTATHRLWRYDYAPQRIGSGVILDGRLYIVNEPGVAECFDLATGKTVWKERLGHTCWGSIVRVGTRLYAVDQDGECVVWRAAPRFEVLARNRLEETTRASPAVSRGQIFIRTYKHLWCIGEEPKKP